MSSVKVEDDWSVDIILKEQNLFTR